MTTNDDSTGNRGREVHGDLSAYVLGALSESGSKALEAHLSTCQRCREELESLAGFVDVNLLLLPPDIFPDEPPATPPPVSGSGTRDAALWRGKSLLRGKSLWRGKRRRPSGNRGAHAAPVQLAFGCTPPAEQDESDVAIAALDAGAARIFTALDSLFRRLGPPTDIAGTSK